MKELWQIMMNLKDWVKGSPIRMLVVAILLRKFWLSRKRKKRGCRFQVSKKTIWRFPWSERQVHGCSHLLLLRGVRRGFTEGSLL